MRIAVVSDSHGDLYMLDKALSMMKNIDMIIHLGDHYKDIIKINEKYNKPIEYVAGNNDYSNDAFYSKVIDINSTRIYITHGHMESVYYGIDKLYLKALENNAKIVLYGHTHIQSIINDKNILYINPGSVSLPRDSKASCILLNIQEDGEVEVQPIRIE